MYKNEKAFTIVELLVVIVVIGVLAAITIVSYSGISQRAMVASLQSDLKNAATKLELAKVDNDSYPTNQTLADLKSSNGITLNYKYKSSTLYCLSATSNNGTVYFITSANQIPTAGNCPIEPLVATWGGTAYDVSNAIANTSDGGFVITGNTGSFGTGGNDVFISKYNSSGILEWNKTWGGASSDTGNAIIQTSDGGYAITGKTFSFGTVDAFLAKFTSAGVLSWSKTWGGASGDEGLGLTQTSDGGYAVIGNTYSYGAGANNSVFLARYTSDGSLTVSRTWGSSNGTDSGYSIKQTSDDGFIVAGHNSSFSVGGNDAFIAKYNLNCGLIWSRVWGGAADDVANSVVITSDGGYAISGYTSSFGAGGYDAFIVKYDSSGVVLWSKTWGGAGGEFSYGLTLAEDNNLALVGKTDSFRSGVANAFLAKFNVSDGSLVWNTTWGGENGQFGNGLAKLTGNGIVISGYTGDYTAGSGDAYFAIFNNNGSIDNCSAPMCQNPTATVSNVTTASVSSPTASVTTPSAGQTSPAPTVTSPMATTNIVVQK